MYHNFVSAKLHSQANSLITELKALTETPTICPYCQYTEFYPVNSPLGYYRCKSCKKGFNRSLNTPFYRLVPLEWLPIIAQRRLCGQNYASIRHELDCSSWVIKRRVIIIEQYMQAHYPELFKWYQDFIDAPKNDVPKAVKEQAKQLKAWINERLQITNVMCPYCQSVKTQKVGETRAQFRCKSCWRYFSGLKGTGLEHIGNSQNWLTMIDMLVAGNNSKEIQNRLGISSNTVTHYRRYWLSIMQQQNLLLLKEWVMGRKQ